MKVTIIGAGKMGSALAKQISNAGHQVRITARDLTKAAELSKLGATISQPQEAVQDADVVILATAYSDAVAALTSVGKIAGKVVIDITNPLSADYMSLTIGHDTSAAEEIARAIPNADVVKGFNTLFAQVLAAGPSFANDQRAPTFVASDSGRAKATAASLAESIGFDVIDAGPLGNARYLEPVGGLNIYFGYGAGHGTTVAPAWIGIK